MNNPEFERQLWLEVSTQRVGLASAVLGAIFFLAFSILGYKLHPGIGLMGVFGFVGLCCLYGSHLATQSLFREVQNRTWENQKMSAIGAWSMTWGKLFGSTIMAWYAGGICLFFYVIAGAAKLPLKLAILWTGSLLCAAVFCQALGFLVALQVIRRGGEAKRSRSFSIVLVLLFFAMANFVGGIAGQVRGTFSWHGIAFDAVWFVFLSVLIFTIWALVGCYRTMRQELQYRNGPWVWIGFVIFLMVYASGFTHLTNDMLVRSSLAIHIDASSVSLLLKYFVAFIVGFGATFATAFVEPKSPVQLRKLAFHVRQGQLSQGLFHVPGWFSSYLLMLVPLALLVVSSLSYNAEFKGFIFRVVAVCVASAFFLMRDIGIILSLHFKSQKGRADLYASLYFLLFYLLLPAIFQSAKVPMIFLAAFWPVGVDPLAVVIALPALEAAFVMGLLYQSWNQPLDAPA